MEPETEMIAVCGLLCHKCDIFLAPENPAIARKIVEWLKRELNVEVAVEEIGCSGCKGDQTDHWSADCPILECCTDRQGLEFCYECVEFPCDMLEHWAERSDRKRRALKRLQKMERETIPLD
jgi:hypothetical protein